MIDKYEYRDENWFVQMFNHLDETIDIFKADYPFVFDSQEAGKKEINTTENSHTQSIGIPQNIQKENIKDINAKKITHDQISLICFYENKVISRENAKELAMQHNHHAKNSGEKIYQRFIFYSKEVNRLAELETKKTLKNKIEKFQSIVQYLKTENAKEWGNREILTLKKSYTKLYPEN